MKKNDNKKIILVSVIVFLVLSIAVFLLLDGFMRIFVAKTFDPEASFSKYFIGSKYETIFSSDEPSVGKYIGFLLTQEKCIESEESDEKNYGVNYVVSSILYDSDGNIIREGGCIPAFKYKDEEISDDYLDTEAYGEIPVEVVFTKEQYDHARELCKNNENFTAVLNSYYKCNNTFYPVSISFYSNGELLETMELKANFTEPKDSVLVENDGMMAGFIFEEGGFCGNYKDEKCAELRESLKEHVKKHGFKDEELVIDKMNGFGRSTYIFMSNHPDKKIVYGNQYNYAAIIIIIGSAVVATMLILLIIIDVVIITVKGRKHAG